MHVISATRNSIKGRKYQNFLGKHTPRPGTLPHVRMYPSMRLNPHLHVYKTTLEYSCNKYCNLIGQNKVSNQLRNLQVY